MFDGAASTTAENATRFGNIIDFGWMDPVAAAQGPEAFAAQQA